MDNQASINPFISFEIDLYMYTQRNIKRVCLPLTKQTIEVKLINGLVPICDVNKINKETFCIVNIK